MAVAETLRDALRGEQKRQFIPPPDSIVKGRG
jgi:hypothetical protein